MNPTSELWLRTAVVTAGTIASVVLASAAVALLPFSRSESSAPQSQTIEAGLMYLPPNPASPSRARHPAVVPPHAKPPPPPEPPTALPPEPSPIPVPKAEEPRPPRQESERQNLASPRMNAPAPSQAQTDEPNRNESAGGTGAAGALFKPTPIIPPELRLHTLDLVAVVRFNIGTDGRPTVVLEKATADPQINEILLDTFRRWRFFPAMRNGKPMRSTLVLRVPIKVQ